LPDISIVHTPRLSYECEDRLLFLTQQNQVTAKTTQGSFRRLEAAVGVIELGMDPPLNPAGQIEIKMDRRTVNHRWLGASVLTALCGALLIGAAIHISLENEGSTAEPPLRSLVGTSSEPGKALASRRGDRLIRSEPIVSAKQNFRAPMTVRTANREIIKVRSFMRVSANLLQSVGVFESDIPAFNPARFTTETSEPEDMGEERSAEIQPEASEADVAVIKRDLMSLTVLENTWGLKDDDVILQIEQEMRSAQEAGRKVSVSIPPQLMLSRILKQPEVVQEGSPSNSPINGAFSAIEISVVPENVTTLPKYETVPRERLIEERMMTLKKGENLETILRTSGATVESLKSVVPALGGRARISDLPEGQVFRVTIAPLQEGTSRQVVRVMLIGENGPEAIAAMNDKGIFTTVAISQPTVAPRPKVARNTPRVETSEEEEESGEDEGTGARLYESLYETGAKYKIAKSTLEDLIRIFSYDLDFQKRVSVGDSLDLFFAQEDDNDDKSEMLYAALTISGEKRQVFRYTSPDDGAVEYFDEMGRSLKKFLMRKPLAEGTFRSGFGYRRHPILGYSKMHTGVDWANRIGTPIFAAGNGSIVSAGWQGGYGRHIEIQHANGYTTTYSHMTSFARNIQAGAKVRQGQVIGYVGSTGLSTGPHLHYEVLVNGNYVDPMKIRVPRGRELEGRSLLEFKRQREQTETIMSKSSAEKR
jgi:murein DD-endopeptidase MepM/ murein hydrolase activator NlpD